MTGHVHDRDCSAVGGPCVNPYRLCGVIHPTVAAFDGPVQCTRITGHSGEHRGHGNAFKLLTWDEV